MKDIKPETARTIIRVLKESRRPKKKPTVRTPVIFNPTMQQTATAAEYKDIHLGNQTRH